MSTRIFVGAVSLLFFRVALSQDSTAYRNNRSIDSLLRTQMICKSNITYPEKYKKSKLKEDLRIIKFVDGTVEKYTYNPTTVDWPKKEARVTNTNGVIKIENFKLLGTYLKGDLIIEFIDSLKTRERIVLTTRTKGSCSEFRDIMMDFNFIRKYVLNNLNVNFKISLDELTFDTLYLDNIKTLAKLHENYKFNVPGTSKEDWINSIFLNQYASEKSCCYQSLKPPAEFIRLIKEQQFDIIHDLLFSPNYFTALNAMEALIYLSDAHKVSLSDADLKRIGEIKNSSIQFKKEMASDFFVTVGSYKELDMTNEKIIKKYQSALTNP